MRTPQVAKIIRMNHTHQPVWMGGQWINDPQYITKAFFEMFPLPECHHYLREMLCAATENERAPAKQVQPSTLRFFYQHLSLLIEAVHLIHTTPPPTNAA